MITLIHTAATPAAPAAALVWPFSRPKAKPKRVPYRFNPARLPFDYSKHKI